MDVYRQRLTIDVVWSEKSGSDPPNVDWQAELAQALNEAHNYCGTLWNMDVQPVEKLETASRAVSRIPGPYWCRRCRSYEIGPICSHCEFSTDVA